MEPTPPPAPRASVLALEEKGERLIREALGGVSQTDWRYVLRPRLAIVAVAVAFLVGCAPARIPVSELSGFEELNQRVGGKTVQVVLASGKVMHARNIHVSADSLSWTDLWIGETASGRWTGERASVPTADVKAIRVHKTARGALKGLLYGAGFGLALAIPTYAANRGLVASEHFGGLSALGVLIGVPFGMGGDEDVYEFISPAGTERTSGGKHRR
jgi:hypothetical protein